MYTWITLVNISLDAAALMLMCLGLMLSFFIRHSTDDWTRRFLPRIFTILICYVSCNLLSQITGMDPGQAVATQILIFLESLFSSALIPMLTLYLLHCFGEDWRQHPHLYNISFLWLIYILLLLAAQFTKIFYYITPDNVYCRGPWYPLLLFPPLLSMALNLLALFLRRQKIPWRQFNAFLIYLMVPVIAMMIQMRFYGLSCIVFATAIATVFLFAYILADQAERNLLQQKENARQQASILVLQMRPHFIYNTMISIYYLCSQNAQKAQQVILDFTTYLRKNFTAIAREDTIPFKEELEHTRAYLAVEQVRFEDNLFVSFDTPFIGFRLPALTLQPIVENAVRHGVGPELEPLQISVSTRLTDGQVELVIADSGRGFQPGDNGEPHTALANIQERLRMLCDGHLLISSREGGGTVVTIRIPAQQEGTDVQENTAVDAGTV